METIQYGCWEENLGLLQGQHVGEEGVIRTSGDELKEVGSHLKWELGTELGPLEGQLEILTTVPLLHPYEGGILIARFGDQHHLNGFIYK